jgi:hypothetical protein
MYPPTASEGVLRDSAAKNDHKTASENELTTILTASWLFKASIYKVGL